MKQKFQNYLALPPLTGSILAASIAGSDCCEGFNLLTLIGFSDSDECLGLTKYRPEFTALSLVLFAVGLFFIYRWRPSFAKVLVGVCVIFVSGFLTLPLYGESIFGKTIHHSPPKFIKPGLFHPVEVVEIKVEGMDCMGCAVGLQNTLGKIEGVHSVNVSLDEMRLRAEIEKGKATKKQLAKVIDDAGFHIVTSENY